MFEQFKSFLSNPVRAKADNFINNLNESKKKVEITHEKVLEDYDSVFKEAFTALKEFLRNTDSEASFLEAAEKLTLCQRLKPSYPEPYFYLAYLFNICGEPETALRYLNAVRIIEPDFEDLQNLEDDIIDNMKARTGEKKQPEGQEAGIPAIRKIPYNQLQKVNVNNQRRQV